MGTGLQRAIEDNAILDLHGMTEICWGLVSQNLDGAFFCIVLSSSYKILQKSLAKTNKKITLIVHLLKNFI